MKKVFALLCAFSLCVTNTSVVHAQETNLQPTAALQTAENISADEPVEIPDPALREAVAEQVDKNDDGIITKAEMETLTYLNAPRKGIKSLEGLQYAKVFPELDLSGNEISDLTPLENLEIPGNLMYMGIYLSNNKITDISPISKFLNTDDSFYMNFSLSNNKITDFSPIYGCDTYHLNIVGNPASDEEYLRLLQLPSDVYLTERTEDYGTYFLRHLAYSYYGFEECLGITFYSDNTDIAVIADVNTYMDVIACGVGETTVYVQHRNAKHPIRVHVGSADGSAKDITAQSAVYNRLEQKVPVFSLLSPADKLGFIARYKWHSSNENIVKVYQNGQSREWYLETVGYGSATITGTSPDGNHSIQLTVTVEEKKTPDNGWFWDGINWYYYENGFEVTGWKQIGTSWYYMYEDGKMASDTWIGECYVDKSGAWIESLKPAKWMQSDSKWWYRNENGTYPTNCWKFIEGSWYYFDTSGYMVTGWKQIGNTWYYLKADGAMTTGWQFISGKWYYFTSSGAMKTGWIQFESEWYYCNASGAMVTGWLQVGKTWYFLRDDGRMIMNNWSDDKNYYFKADGAMAVGWQIIDGKYYYFTASGMKAKNQWIGNYYLKEDGVMATNEWVDNGKYWVDSTGKWIPDYQK